jgi:hypothetical protein
VGEQPGSGNPIVTRPPPNTTSPDWDKAKTAVQIADGNYHEAVSHLGRPIWWSKRSSWRLTTSFLATPFTLCCGHI